MQNKKFFISGLVVTLIWLAIVGYVTYRISPTLPTTLNEWGDFLAGVFSPLALFWFILAFLQQAEELRLSTLEVKNSVDQFKLQSAELTESNEIEKYKLSMAEWERLHLELSSILSSYLYQYFKQKPADKEFVSNAWEAYSKGDKNTFFRTVAFHCDTKNTSKLDQYLHYNVEKRKRFLWIFDELEKLAHPGNSELPMLVTEEMRIVRRYFSNKNQ